MQEAAVLRTPADYETFRIAAGDTNRMALIADPIRDGVTFTAIVEIFDPGGKTPPNTHAEAAELFFVLSGRGRAWCDGRSVEVSAGDSLLVRPGSEHVFENVGSERLYCLTIMVPNEGFAELIRRGLPAPLDAADVNVLKGG